MLTEGSRQVDLYDFFSVLVPGAAFTLGMLPFLPNNAEVFSLALLGILIVGGFVFGRLIHATGFWIEETFGHSHRTSFQNELIRSKKIDKDLVDQYYQSCCKLFKYNGLPKNRHRLDDEDKDYSSEISTIYSLTRSYIHMDARGRSRTFQAVLDFYRTLWATSGFLAVVYTLYAIGSGFELISSEVVGYTSYIGTLGIHPVLVFFIPASVFGGSYILFKRVRRDYRDYFVHYLMVDFIILYTDTQADDETRSEPFKPFPAIRQIESE